MIPNDPVLTASAVRHGFADRPDFLGPIDLSVGRGELLGIIGPNGAGKTTLLRLLAGIVRPHAGVVRLETRDLHRMSPRDRAARIAYLPQKPPADLAATALEVVLMGRYPHRAFNLFESPEDFAVCRQAMELTGTWEFADRTMATLSGGEAQRVHLAASLAQSPEILLLDEPTSALDVYHQFAVFELLAFLMRERGMAGVVVVHDLNLAGCYCSRLLLLSQGVPGSCGPPEEVLKDEVLAPVYGVHFAFYRAPGRDRAWLFPQPAEIGSPPAGEGSA